jgi:hypothetical protein
VGATWSFTLLPPLKSSLYLIYKSFIRVLTNVEPAIMDINNRAESAKSLLSVNTKLYGWKRSWPV